MPRHGRVLDPGIVAAAYMRRQRIDAAGAAPNPHRRVVNHFPCSRFLARYRAHSWTDFSPDVRMGDKFSMVSRGWAGQRGNIGVANHAPRRGAQKRDQSMKFSAASGLQLSYWRVGIRQQGGEISVQLTANHFVVAGSHCAAGSVGRQQSA